MFKELSISKGERFSIRRSVEDIGKSLYDFTEFLGDQSAQLSHIAGRELYKHRAIILCSIALSLAVSSGTTLIETGILPRVWNRHILDTPSITLDIGDCLNENITFDMFRDPHCTVPVDHLDTFTESRRLPNFQLQ